MKLAFALFEYFPYGGLQRDMLAIAEAAAKRGHQVVIHTRKWHGPVPSALTVEVVATSGASNHARDKAFVSGLATRLAGFDRVVGFNKMPGLDFYYAADGCLAAKYRERYRGLWRCLPRYQSRLTMEAAVFKESGRCRILSISRSQKAFYQRYYHTQDSRFIDLPPGIRRDRAQPDDLLTRRTALRDALGLTSEEPMLLFVGSGFRTKGLDRAIRVLAALPATTKLFVVGDDHSAPYRRLARRLRVADRLHFMGGRDDVPEWLWASDLLLHPAYAENTGTVLLEAAIAGLPVLTTSACGYASYIEQAGMGKVLQEPKPETLANAAQALLKTPRDQWRERGRCFAAASDIYDLVEHAVDAIETSYPESVVSGGTFP